MLKLVNDACAVWNCLPNKDYISFKVLLERMWLCGINLDEEDLNHLLMEMFSEKLVHMVVENNNEAYLCKAVSDRDFDQYVVETSNIPLLLALEFEPEVTEPICPLAAG